MERQIQIMPPRRAVRGRPTRRNVEPQEQGVPNAPELTCCISSLYRKLLVYEYFEKQSLDKWLHGKKRAASLGQSSTPALDWRKRLNIAIGASQGLCYMHHHCTRPIIHRDIKSSNILLDSEFNAKIADFGLAKILSRRDDDPETTSAIAGTFGYIAPEYALTSKVNVKTDIYSYGVVLLELTTGR
ncbi:receptor-like serine/threonine-protein kinase At1g78530 [Solanum stenotomum]|uniref:receptor-like serine/threonine-protein kinase At1g78530 n=1 Tax=Solanum stenotomum TaxID=172797 RepID=UPI0020D0CE37|nr:receptor-like serine/threonine-protein kinase At1g78530 [Solanum stenotomum]